MKFRILWTLRSRNSLAKNNMKSVVAYVPVLHDGYLQFFNSHAKGATLYIFGTEIIDDYKPLTKDIRHIDPDVMQSVITKLNIFNTVEILDKATALSLNTSETIVVLPNEDVSRDVAATYFPNAALEFDSIFLRWDKHNALAEKPVVPDEQISHDQFHRSVLEKAETDSSDIWRHVGASIVKDVKILLTAHNEHVPSQHTSYVYGDARSNFSRGEHIEISTAFHAEASLIATAAKQGIALLGADMYVTVFPCPPCAKLIAYSGIKNLYCKGGYAVLDGQDILKSRGVKIIFVE
jgi:dCMP deaminase